MNDEYSRDQHHVLLICMLVEPRRVAVGHGSPEKVLPEHDDISPFGTQRNTISSSDLFEKSGGDCWVSGRKRYSSEDLSGYVKDAERWRNHCVQHNTTVKESSSRSSIEGYGSASVNSVYVVGRPERTMNQRWR